MQPVEPAEPALWSERVPDTRGTGRRGMREVKQTDCVHTLTEETLQYNLITHVEFALTIGPSPLSR